MGNGTQSPSKNDSQFWLDRNRLFGLLSVFAAVFLVLAVLIRTPDAIVDGLPFASWSAVSPFGVVEVAVVHVLTGFIVSWTVARQLRPIMSATHRGTILIAVLVGGLLAVFTLYFGRLDAWPGAAMGAGARFWLRMIWVAALQLPWCIAAVNLLLPPDPVAADDTSLSQLVMPLLAAVLLPMAHSGHVARREARAIVDEVAQQQYMRAWRQTVTLEAIAGVQEIGGQVPNDSWLQVRPEGGRFSDSVRSDLVQQLFAKIRESNQELPPIADVATVMARASTLLSLDALREAVELLEDLDERRPDALLLLATIYEEQQDSGKAVETLEEAAGLIGDAKGDDVVPVVQGIYQRLAQNLRREQRYQEAESRLLEAIDRYDHSHGFFYFELGLHCHQGGRFQTAIDYYKSAVLADDRYAPRAEGAIRQLRVETPACMLRPSKLASR